MNPIPKITPLPPPGRPNWKSEKELDLLYLGWGERNYKQAPLDLHYDNGTNYFIILKGEITLITNQREKNYNAPHGFIFDPDFAFGITQKKNTNIVILDWVWKGRPTHPHFPLKTGSCLDFPINNEGCSALQDLHYRCRSEVAKADDNVPLSLPALRTLLEVQLLRSYQPPKVQRNVRWQLAKTWMKNNLVVQAPVPALCDYLGMSAPTLYRFFMNNIGISPGEYFRTLKLTEARRLIHKEKLLLKTVAYRLGYRHPNDLSRALQKSKK